MPLSEFFLLMLLFCRASTSFSPPSPVPQRDLQESITITDWGGFKNARNFLPYKWFFLTFEQFVAHEVVVHALGSDLRNFGECEFHESITSGSSSLWKKTGKCVCVCVGAATNLPAAV